jgi:uncharacterized SAM-binding protein YcdF (DUF218 family)
MSTKPPPLDALIVLGARLNPLGQPGRIGRMRLAHALTLWQEQGGDALVIITGGPTHGTGCTEARAMADFALSLAEETGGKEMRKRLKERLLLEEKSQTTDDSARHTLPVIQEFNLKKIGLISDGLHIHRAHYLFRRHFRRHPKISLHPLPVPGIMKVYWQNRRYLWLTKMALREGGAWLKVLARRALFWR